MTFDTIRVDPKALGLEDLKKIAEQEVTATVRRTVSAQFKGVDADGAAFRPYSKKYAELRAKKGLGATVNLSVSGELKGSRMVGVSPTNDGAEGIFSGTHKGGLSNAELASILESKGFKDFHAFGKVDVDRIHKRFEKEIEKSLNKLLDVKKGA